MGFIFKKYSIYPRIIIIFILMNLLILGFSYFFIVSKSLIVFFIIILGLFLVNYLGPYVLLTIKKTERNEDLEKKVLELAKNMHISLKNIYLVDTNLGGYVINKTVFIDKNYCIKNKYDKVEAVIAHELGHVKNYDRIQLSIRIFVLLSIAMVINLNIYASSELNIVSLIITTLIESIIIYPIYVSFSRHREHLADLAAIKNIKDPYALVRYFQDLINKVTIEGINLPEKAPFSYKYLYTHPYVRDRIRFIESYKK